ncbi:MAG: hypothetical protein ACREK5_02225 [Gemmatimonadota bacterium]
MFAEKSLAVFTVCLAAASCASGGTAASDSPVEPVLKVQVAALQYVFRNNDSRLGTGADSYCVGVGTGLLHSDPPSQLVRLLQSENLQVTRLSNCVKGRDTTGSWQVVDALSRLPSLAFFVEEPVFPDGDTARVYLEYIESPRSSTGYDCTLGRTTEGWEVQDRRGGFPR